MSSSFCCFCNHLVNYLIELKSAVGQIHHGDKYVLAVEQNKVLIPPSYNKYLAWGYSDLSVRIGNYESDKVRSYRCSYLPYFEILRRYYRFYISQNKAIALLPIFCFILANSVKGGSSVFTLSLFQALRFNLTAKNKVFGLLL